MVGHIIEHYRILRKIGEGGMGHVYLAQDLQLDRHVAIKTLAETGADRERTARFEREAKAAAALNHPNILAIYGYGVHEAMPYLVMELLQGQTLRQVLQDDGPLSAARALDYGIELGSGLSAAHDQGICHRDLKPDNIFVTIDGRLKILDFGLATERGAAALTSPADQVTRAAVTMPGLMLGTVGYMAPEQIRGERVDVRADVFAVGAVLFEMLTGRRAFDEPSAVETLHAILKLDPPFHLLTAAAVPSSAIEIVRRCLQKGRDERFQSAHDLRHALKGARPAADAPPVSATPRFGDASDGPASPTLERVTHTLAVTLSPALSDDGRLVAYVSDGGEDDTAPQVWMQQIGGTAIRLTTGLRECAEPAFSADHTRVLFTARAGATLNVYQVPALGGEPRIVKRNAKAARESPDGRWLSYVSLDAPTQVRLARADGDDDRVMAPDLINASCAVWSPDSQHLLVRAHVDTAFERDYWIVPVDGRPSVNTGIVERFKTHGVNVLDFAPAWLSTSLVFGAGNREGVLLWRQRLVGDPFELSGPLEPLTHGTEWAGWPSAAANRLAFVGMHPDYNLWSVPVDASSGAANGPPQRMTRGPGLMGQLSLTTDGKLLVYFSTRTRKPELVLRNLETATERLLTAEPMNAVKSYPAVSPSGAQLAHGTVVPGPRALRPIVVVDLARGTARQLSDDSGGRPRQWIDERHLLIETFAGRLNSFALVDTSTGIQRALLGSAHRSLSNPRVSPDARRVAFDATPPGGSPVVMVAPLEGHQPVSESDWVVVEEAASHPFWSRDGRLLYFLPVLPNHDFRSRARARRLDASGRPDGDTFDAVTFNGMFVPTMVPGTAPFVAADAIICVLADLRGDIWVRSV